MLPSQRHEFDIPADVAYFNCAYMSPLMNAVQQAGNQAIAAKAQPWTTAPEDFFTRSDACRSLFAKIINARPEDIAIVPSVSYGLATAARNLSLDPDSTILVLEDQFPSNIYSWRELAQQTGAQLKTIKRPKAETSARGSNELSTWTQAILNTIDNTTALLALPHCHWVDGGLIDLEAVSQAARARGAALVLDITQSGGVMPIDVARVEPDFLVCACYKWLLGPYAIGFLYVHPKWQQGEPLEQGWIARKGSQDFTRLIDYQNDYHTGAVRFDMGERSSFQLMPMAHAALRQILDWGVENIYQTLSELTQTIAHGAQQQGFSCAPIGQRAGHYLGLRAPNGLPATLTADLAERNIYVSVRGDSLRVTPHLYNTPEDCTRLLTALAELT